MGLQDRIKKIRNEYEARGWKEHDFEERTATGDMLVPGDSWFPRVGTPLGTGINEAPLYDECRTSNLKEGETFAYLGRTWKVAVSAHEGERCNYQAALLLVAVEPAVIDPDFRPPVIEIGQVIPVRFGLIERQGLDLFQEMFTAGATDQFGTIGIRVWHSSSSMTPPQLLTSAIQYGLTQGGAYMLPSLSPSGVELVDRGSFTVDSEKTAKLIAQAAVDAHAWRAFPTSAATAEQILRMAFMSTLRRLGFWEMQRSRRFNLQAQAAAFVHYLREHNIPISLEA